MRKTALVIAILMAASSPAFAKAKKAKPAPKPAPISQNEASLKLVVDALPVLLPGPAKVVYFNMQKKEAKK